jgi:hypothetical protein
MDAADMYHVAPQAAIRKSGRGRVHARRLSSMPLGDMVASLSKKFPVNADHL